MGHSVEWSTRTRHQEDRFPLRGAACVVEPDDAAREQIALTLRRMGYATHETSSGAAACFIVANIRLEALLINLVLPDAKGLQLIRQFRRAHPALRIVALAPTAPSVFAELAHFAGADAVLGSPVCAEAVCAALTEKEGSWAVADSVSDVTAPSPTPA